MNLIISVTHEMQAQGISEGRFPMPARGCRLLELENSDAENFTRYLYKPQPLIALEGISAHMLAIEEVGEDVLGGLLKGGKR